MASPRIVVYTTTPCGYCRRAKQALHDAGLEFEEIDVRTDDTLREWLIDATGGRRTLPQVFIDGRSIGGHEELVDWLRSGSAAS
jgi:glutaredoxin 3